MADNVTINTPVGTRVLRTVDNGGVHTQAELVAWSNGGIPTIVTSATPLPVSHDAPHVIGGYTLTAKNVRVTTAQTGSAIWTPSAGKRVIITALHVSVGGTTAGDVQIWFGASADTTFTRGTDLAIMDAIFSPSNTIKYYEVMSGVFPASVSGHVLRLTTSAAMTVAVVAWGYEI